MRLVGIKNEFFRDMGTKSCVFFYVIGNFVPYYIKKLCVDHTEAI